MTNQPPQLTDEQVFSQVNPDARCVQIIRGKWNIVYGDDPNRIGFSNIVEPAQRTQLEAWALAVSRLPVIQGTATETATDEELFGAGIVPKDWQTIANHVGISYEKVAAFFGVARMCGYRWSRAKVAEPVAAPLSPEKTK